MVKYIVFYVYHRPYELWSPVIVQNYLKILRMLAVSGVQKSRNTASVGNTYSSIFSNIL